MKVLVSACLLGERVRYNGAVVPVDSRIGKLEKWATLIPFCPEVEGGLLVPRPPAEIKGGDGSAVFENKASVSCEDGTDVTSCFIAGANKALGLVKIHEIEFALMKDGSPSCGSSYVYDGSFTKTRIPGKGVAAALLEKFMVRVYSEHEIEALICNFRGTR